MAIPRYHSHDGGEAERNPFFPGEKNFEGAIDSPAASTFDHAVRSTNVMDERLKGGTIKPIRNNQGVK